MVMSAIEKTKAKLGRKATWCWVGVTVLYRMVSNKVTFEERLQALEITKGKEHSRQKE